MAERLDYKTLAFGVVIYVAGIFALGRMALPVLGADIVDRYAFDFVVSALVAFGAGYVVRRRTGRHSRNYSVILALFLLAFNLIVTISDLFRSDGDPLWINLAYDATITLSIVLGGIYGGKKLRRRDAKQGCE